MARSLFFCVVLCWCVLFSLDLVSGWRGGIQSDLGNIAENVDCKLVES